MKICLFHKWKGDGECFVLFDNWLTGMQAKLKSDLKICSKCGNRKYRIRKDSFRGYKKGEIKRKKNRWYKHPNWEPLRKLKYTTWG